MLLGGNAGHWLKPMGKMGGTVFHGPVLHSCCHCIGNIQIQLSTLVDSFSERLINICRESCAHNSVVKDQASKIICNCCHSISSFHYFSDGFGFDHHSPAPLMGRRGIGPQQHFLSLRSNKKEKALMGQRYPLRHQRLFMWRNIHSIAPVVNSKN